MKKKIFAALCAAVVALCGLCAPVSAESAYKKGDVNMDGKADVDDAQMILLEYCCAGVMAMPVSFTEEQIALATITGQGTKIPQDHVDLPFSVADAQIILMYYVSKIAGKDVPDDVVEFYQNMTQYIKILY